MAKGNSQNKSSGSEFRVASAVPAQIKVHDEEFRVLAALAIAPCETVMERLNHHQVFLLGLLEVKLEDFYFNFLVPALEKRKVAYA